ncbi:MAG: hypothetical protein Q7S60_02130 [bacterium]|nr:hypothetical protein [bacterium]
MKKTKIGKIPSIFKNVDLLQEVFVTDKIKAEEGAFVVVEALEDIDKKNGVEFKDGRLGKVRKGDVFPGVLGYRKAPVEFAGFVPPKVYVGQELYLLCESGLIGDLSGIYNSWGNPMSVRVLGGIVDKKGKSLNLKDFAFSKIKQTKKKIPLVAFIATRMDSGKTITACKVVSAFSQLGKKVAAVKMTGVAYNQDLYKLQDSGASAVYDFVDMGLPSTCNSNTQAVISAAKQLISYAKRDNPDMIVAEFGEGIIGDYHNLDVLSDPFIKSQVSFLVLAAIDLAGVYGSTQILKKECGLIIDLVTGPAVNSQVGVEAVKKYFNLESESNLSQIPRTVSAIHKKVFEKNNESNKTLL